MLKEGDCVVAVKTRIVLADDHLILLDTLERLLEAECEVLGQVTDGGALVALLHTSCPDVVVLDISMPVLNGLEAGRRIKQAFPGIKLVFLTMHEELDFVVEAFNVGASAYLLKR